MKETPPNVTSGVPGPVTTNISLVSKLTAACVERDTTPKEEIVIVPTFVKTPARIYETVKTFEAVVPKILELPTVPAKFAGIVLFVKTVISTSGDGPIEIIAPGNTNVYLSCAPAPVVPVVPPSAPANLWSVPRR